MRGAKNVKTSPNSLCREEADRLCGELRTSQLHLEEVKSERSKLVEINTELSHQVGENDMKNVLLQMF